MDTEGIVVELVDVVELLAELDTNPKYTPTDATRITTIMTIPRTVLETALFRRGLNTIRNTNSAFRGIYAFGRARVGPRTATAQVFPLGPSLQLLRLTSSSSDYERGSSLRDCRNWVLLGCLCQTRFLHSRDPDCFTQSSSSDAVLELGSKPSSITNRHSLSSVATGSDFVVGRNSPDPSLASWYQRGPFPILNLA